MTTLRTLARRSTDLDDAAVDHLHLLVAEWHLLADLSFADLLLLVRVRGEDAFLTVAQMRPTTGQTTYPEDMVGGLVPAAERFLVERAWREDRICREADPDWQSGVPVRQEAIPVRYAGRAVAVISRDSNLTSVRVPSELELTYLRTADDLARMVAEGAFPAPGEGSSDPELSPRVGDGVIRLDPEGVVEYASPNALSAYRRLGVTRNLTGERLDDLGLPGVDTRRPSEDEVECAGAVVLRRGIPLGHGGDRIGVLVLVRDVTELRRRERQLLSKDATIREIHHRVKNNLQTVAALLRLQSRRLTSPEARAALEESVRRVSSIALVHETLSRAPGEAVPFDDVVDKVAAMVADVATAESPVTTRRVGSAGLLPAEVATPLALVLAELLQNAVEHAFAVAGGRVEVELDRQPDVLRVTVADDGAGLPEGFALEGSTRLGLQIVRTLVVSELGGAIELRPRDGVRGTEVRLSVPLRRR